MNHKTDMEAPTEIYVWFADNKGTERDGERFIRAWTMDPVRADGLRGAIGRAPAVYRTIEASQSAGVTEGYALVPVEPTVEMLMLVYDPGAKETPSERYKKLLSLAAAPAPVSEPADMPEGCTPADAEMLRVANHSLAVENDRLRRRLRPFAQLASSPLSWAMVEYCVADDPEKQTLQAPQMQRAFNRAAEALRADPSPSSECGEQDCPHGVDDGACKQCYGEATSGEQGVVSVVCEAIEAAFEERDGWRVKVAAAVRAIGAASAPTLGEEPYASIIDHVRRGGVVKLLTHDEAVADASAPTLGEPVASVADRRRWEKVLSFAKGIIDRLDTREVMRSSVSGTAYDAAERAVFIRNLATEALAAPQPQAAEPKGEPAAWINYPCKIENNEFAGHGEPELTFKRQAYGYDLAKAEPLYRAAEPKGLTEAIEALQYPLTEDIIKQVGSLHGYRYDDRIVFYGDNFTNFAEALVEFISYPVDAATTSPQPQAAETNGLTDEQLEASFHRELKTFLSKSNQGKVMGMFRRALLAKGE